MKNSPPCFLIFCFGRLAVLDDEAEVMQAGPVRAALAALGAFGEMQQRQIHHAVGQRDGVADRGFDLGDALEIEHAFVEGRGLFEVGDLDRDVSELGHDASPLNDRRAEA